MRWLSDKIGKRKDESEVSSGMLYSTGLVAGGSIAGLLVAVLISLPATQGFVKSIAFGEHWNVLGIFGESGEWSALFMFAVLCFFLVRRSLKKLEI
jgi:hypothetical protein